MPKLPIIFTVLLCNFIVSATAFTLPFWKGGTFLENELVEGGIKDVDADPETTPDLFQGDIAMDEDSYAMLRIGINPMKYPKKLWGNRTIPFKINEEYDLDERVMIEKVLMTMSSLTCLNFVPRNEEYTDYIHIKPSNKSGGCWSYVGRSGGEQVVSLQKKSGKNLHCFSSEGRIMHELMHAVGIYHEQSRPDRDKFVKVLWENIVPKYKKNFKLISEEKGIYSFDYDYKSVMHYGLYYFSKEKGKKPTVVPIDPKVRIGQRKTLSKIDCLKINSLYGCLKGREKRKYQTFCKLLAI